MKTATNVAAVNAVAGSPESGEVAIPSKVSALQETYDSTYDRAGEELDKDPNFGLSVARRTARQDAHTDKSRAVRALLSRRGR